MEEEVDDMDGSTRARGIARFTSSVLLCLGSLAAGGQAGAVEPPSAPATSTGDYTVSYAHCSGCLADWLEERPAGGSWRVAGTGAVSFSAKPAGTYYYRVAYWYTSDPSYTYQWTDYSAEVAVVVAAVAPPLEPLDTQRTYRYETRSGDANGDGRTDLLLSRISGGQAGDGTLDKVLLIQDAAGHFASSVPSATQLSVAKGWPRTAIRVILDDFNVDGFIDVFLKGVGAAVAASGVPSQIVYAPGRTSSARPLGVRAVDAELKSFAAESRDYFADSGYFVDNAPVSIGLYPVTGLGCESWGWTGDGYSGLYGCLPIYVAIAVTDYSGFNQAALSAWSNESSIAASGETVEQGQNAIKTAYETALGVPIGGRDFGGIRGERGALDEPSYRRGLELFLAVLGIYDASADELNPPRETGRKPDVVYVTGRKILGFLPRHTALEYNGSTLSAHDSDDRWLTDGLLVSQKDWLNDTPLLMMTLGTVTSALAPSWYWSQLVATDAGYDDNLPYNAVPSADSSGYNSNGYSHGLVLATAGIPSIDMNHFVGGAKPVPASAFH
jgi:hypothetical protein